MNSAEFKKVVEFASKMKSSLDVDTSVLHGCATEGFKRVSVDVKTAAAALRWDCLCLNGDWDFEALNMYREIYRLKVELLPL